MKTLADLDAALDDMKTTSSLLDSDQTAQVKTATALQSAKDADDQAKAKVATDRDALQAKADAVVAAIAGLGLTVNAPAPEAPPLV